MKRYEIWVPAQGTGKSHAADTRTDRVICGAGGYLTVGRSWVYLGAFATRQEAAEHATCESCKAALAPIETTQ